MPDLHDGSTECDPFPETALPTDELAAVLADRLAEVPEWRSAKDPVRLGFAMSEPHPLALHAAGMFAARNPNNVGVHTRFGDGVRGTRRLEREAVLALGGLMRADSADGYLTSGANEGTLAGLRVGRNALRAAGCRRVLVIASALTHHSVAKAAEILDLGFKALPAGPSWVLEPGALEEAFDALEADGEDTGVTGVIVVSTAGYYNTGLTDPVDRISALLGRRTDAPSRLRFFHHVDAAHGGMILPFTAPDIPFDFRNRFVHSMVLDPHKSGLMPYSCGVFLCRKGLLGHGAIPAPMSGFVDETVTGSRSGATAAALWSLVFGLAAEGYRETFRGCLDLRGRLGDVILAADPDAVLLPSPGNTVLVVGFSTEGGHLPGALREHYRLVGNALPWTDGQGRVTDRLFHHFYVMPHMTERHVDGFGADLAAALAAAVGEAGRAAPVAEAERAATEPPVPAELKHLRGTSACLRHLVVHPPQRRDPDDYPHAYSFHTFRNRAELGEQLRVETWPPSTGTEAQGGGELLVYAPDFGAPFANELFGVLSPRKFSLEVLDRNQQKLSLVGAAHLSVFEDADERPHTPVLLANFHGDGGFRSAEYKWGDRWHADELQVFEDSLVVKVGKDARSIRRTGDDYSFSIDTSLELRVMLTDGDAPPRLERVAQHTDPALPRRRHLLRGQYQRFPNRFFDVIVSLTVGRGFTGTVGTDGLLAEALQGGPLLARSAGLGLARVLPRFAEGRLVTGLEEVRGEGSYEMSVDLGLGARLHRELEGIDVTEPENLEPRDVVAWAERLHPVARRLQLAAVDRDGVRHPHWPTGASGGKASAVRGSTA
ncbi:pyridoxal-dependent decarboxylase [Streptomyces lasiicapitis]|uniref:pyridoxal phosphate-dependent decarboxylase family protein n=1 Tax=Streptomyces lasiicapitis TaxID=1923961 RepID=UPI0033291933